MASTASKKINRYKNIFKRLNNKTAYFSGKLFGFGSSFKFDIKGFGEIEVPKRMMGPFRENFFDAVYFKGFPQGKLESMELQTVIDIGANVGFFSLSVFADYPEAKVYAFEPHPYNFKLLNERKEVFAQLDWEVFNTAVAGEEGTITLNASTLDGFATMASIHANASNVESVEVEALDLAQAMQIHNINQVDLLKLDCEGAEYPILYNAPDETFQKIKSICIETHQTEEQDHNQSALHQFIKEKGYQTATASDTEKTGYIWAWK